MSDNEDKKKQEELMRTMALLKVAFDMKHKKYHGFEYLVDSALKDLHIDPLDFAKFTQENREPLEQTVKKHGYNQDDK
ncbi:MAG: hypothetical protein GXP49_06050 [Deltaproteobacteria bacterium]|nr:hypothetical protein [Deltaproteobacteria bacterium]